MNADDRTTPASKGLYTPRSSESGEQTTPARSPFMPVSQQVPTSTEQPAAAPAPVSRPTPVSTPTPVSSPAPTPAPTTGSVPQRTAFRPTSGAVPTSTQTPVSAQAPTTASAPAAAPVSGQAPVSAQPATRPSPAYPPAGTSFAPASSPQPTAPASSPQPAHPGVAAGAGAALGAGTAKIKGLAGRAAESFKAGDDLAVPSSKGGPRKARVLLSRIDPWSALKLGFLLSIAAGIMLVVAVFVIWNVLNSMGTFALINDWVVQLFTTEQEINIMQFFEFNRVMSAATLVAVVNVVLLTALTAIASFLYNVVASVVGGVYVTLTDD